MCTDWPIATVVESTETSCGESQAVIVVPELAMPGCGWNGVIVVGIPLLIGGYTCGAGSGFAELFGNRLLAVPIGLWLGAKLVETL